MDRPAVDHRARRSGRARRCVKQRQDLSGREQTPYELPSGHRGRGSEGVAGIASLTKHRRGVRYGHDPGSRQGQRLPGECDERNRDGQRHATSDRRVLDKAVERPEFPGNERGARREVRGGQRRQKRAREGKDKCTGGGGGSGEAAAQEDEGAQSAKRDRQRDHQVETRNVG